jgi:SAM-dependent methyltransferase
MYHCSFSRSELLAKAMGVFTSGCNYGLMRVLRRMSKDIDILDVGCGSGRLLHSLRSLGFTGRLLGLDAFLTQGQNFENRVEIKRAELISFTDAKGFDVISLMHTFEHVAEQDESLSAIKRLLKSGGVCVISIPIAGSAQWDRFTTQWVQMDPPRHFFLHTPRSLMMLAERNGMTVSHMVRESSAFQFWGTALVRKGIPIIPMSKSYVRSLWRIPFDMARAALADYKGTGDTATFVLARQ